MSKKISLKQFLMKTGMFEKAEDCIAPIRNGEITIDGNPITNPSFFFNPKTSLVKLKSEKLRTVKKLYFIMNKPADFVCQKSKDEKTIYELLNKLSLNEKILNSLFAIGRLDKDTEGLLIATNDGKLSDMLMQPESSIIKKYYAILEKAADINQMKKLEKGIEIELDEGMYKTKKSAIKITGEKEVYISITEGKKRQIRKMFEAIGNKVVYLKRVSIGGLQLGKLAVGEIKEIGREEMYNKLNIQ